MAIDQSKLDEFLGRGVDDMGAALGGLLMVVGDKLGLYKAMAPGSGVAQRAGELRICDLRSGDADVHAARGAGLLSRQRREHP